MSTQQKIKLGGVAILLLCLLPLPYGVYMIARVAIMILGGYLALDYLSHKNKTLAITFAAVALIFQPFLRIPLGRELWMIVDVAVALLLIVLVAKKR